MITCSITPDLFDSEMVKVDYEIHLNGIVKSSIRLKKNGVVSWLHLRLMNVITDTTTSMTSQRNENYKRGEHIKEAQSKAILILNEKIIKLRVFENIKNYAVFYEENVLPSLITIRPSVKSRFHANYVKKLTAIDSCIDKILHEPGFLSIEKAQEIGCIL